MTSSKKIGADRSMSVRVGATDGMSDRYGTMLRRRPCMTIRCPDCYRRVTCHHDDDHAWALEMHVITGQCRAVPAPKPIRVKGPVHQNFYATEWL